MESSFSASTSGCSASDLLWCFLLFHPLNLFRDLIFWFVLLSVFGVLLVGFVGDCLFMPDRTLLVGTSPRSTSDIEPMGAES